MQPERSEASLTAAAVDTREWGPTEDDEEAVLEALYGPADSDGIYRGEGLS
jgi:hypothetical protein